MLMCRCCVESLDAGNFDQIQCIVGGSALIPAVQLDQLLRYTYMCTFLVKIHLSGNLVFW